jgi:hypothetical protein
VSAPLEVDGLVSSCSVALEVAQRSIEPAECLGFVVDAGGVLDRVAGAFFGQAAGEDLLCGPVVDGVGGDFDFEHPVGEVFADAAFWQAGFARGAFERFEFAAAFIDGDDPRLWIEVERWLET